MLVHTKRRTFTVMMTILIHIIWMCLLLYLVDVFVYDDCFEYYVPKLNY